MNPNNEDTLNGRDEIKDLIFLAAQKAEEKKAIDTEILDITKYSDLADYMVISSGSSPSQLKAIASHIEDSLSIIGVNPSYKEGKYGDKWFSLDYQDFIVHIIDEDTRNFYNLEELWQDAFFVPQHEWEEASFLEKQA